MKYDLTYKQALHGIQSAIKYTMNNDPSFTTPKHLRVGIDSCFVTDGAVARLLIAKGIFTEEEYAEEVRLEANRELERYEKRIFDDTGIRLKFR